MRCKVTGLSRVSRESRRRKPQNCENKDNTISLRGLSVSSQQTSSRPSSCDRRRPSRSLRLGRSSPSSSPNRQHALPSRPSPPRCCRRRLQSPIRRASRRTRRRHPQSPMPTRIRPLRPTMQRKRIHRWIRRSIRPPPSEMQISTRTKRSERTKAKLTASFSERKPHPPSLKNSYGSSLTVFMMAGHARLTGPSV